ncbi:hypothetical protein LINPERPRIM_LOCUS38158 [Linum perenne]
MMGGSLIVKSVEYYALVRVEQVELLWVLALLYRHCTIIVVKKCFRLSIGHDTFECETESKKKMDYCAAVDWNSKVELL